MLLPRRLVLKLLTALGAALTLPTTRTLANTVEQPACLSRCNALLDILPDRKSAAVVGREYLRVTPREADPERLCELLWPAAEDAQADPTEMLARRQEEDFAEGHIVVLRGWILARTEARLCALAALCNGRLNSLIA